MGRNRKSGHDQVSQLRIREVPIEDIQPSPENDRPYLPIDPKDLDIVALGQSIGQYGLKEPIVVSEDGYILSGHRRYIAAKLAGLKTVPCRIEPIRRKEEPDRFLQLLREYNRQRTKTNAERLREEVVSADPEEAYYALVEHRQKQSELMVPQMEIGGTKRRSRISEAKAPFLKAIRDVIEARREYWPLSDRQIHYALLNNPPLRHASKPHSRYDNTLRSYKSLVDLLTRARLEGHIPMDVIGDETRPVSVWSVWPAPGEFLRDEMNKLFKGYWRNLMQS